MPSAVSDGRFLRDVRRGRRACGPLLGLTLTSRDKGADAVPMAGFPHPALDTYLAKIVQAGLRAAVCEQVEDPRWPRGWSSATWSGSSRRGR